MARGGWGWGYAVMVLAGVPPSSSPHPGELTNKVKTLPSLELRTRMVKIRGRDLIPMLPICEFHSTNCYCLIIAESLTPSFVNYSFHLFSKSHFWHVTQDFLPFNSLILDILMNVWKTSVSVSVSVWNVCKPTSWRLKKCTRSIPLRLLAEIISMRSIL